MFDSQSTNAVTSPDPMPWAAMTHPGKERDQNQDAFIVEPDCPLFLVADGMGGHRGGDLASEIVIQDLPVLIETKLAKIKNRNTRNLHRLLTKAVTEQNRQLHLEGHSESGYKDMGSTLVLALILNQNAYIAALGDSRIYRLRRQKLRQLTPDHSVVAELLEKGQIEPEQAENHDAQGQLTQYVGMPAPPEPFVRTIPLIRQDRLLLCTDGLTDMLDDTQLQHILQNEPEPLSACKAAIDAANAAGGHDNITAVIIDYQ